MTFVISVINTKGGVAKTTTSVVLAHLISEATGDRVVLLDLDRQGDATAWSAGLAAAGNPIAAEVQAVAPETQPEWLADKIEDASEGADFLIIDTGPGDLRRIGASVAAARRYGGVCLVPTSPANLDLTRAIVTIDDQIAGKALAMILLVRTKARTINLREAREGLAELADGSRGEDEEPGTPFTVLDAHVPEREKAKNTTDLGMVCGLYEQAATELFEWAVKLRA